MDIVLVGLSHRLTPLEIRERLALSKKEVPAFLHALREGASAEEAVVLSTCNRVEITGTVPAGEIFLPHVAGTLSTLKKVPLDTVETHLYEYRLPESVKHLFAVASSLDSLVVGEPQILGQMKEAYEQAREAGTVGKLLSEAFEKAFSVAKRIRTETQVAERPVSIPTIAVELARKVIGDLRNHRVLVLGAGEMGSLTARALVSRGVRTVVVSSRHHPRALELAEALGGSARRYEDLEEELQSADMVVACTTAPHTVLTAEMLERAMNARRHRPLFIIDLAVPRDVEPGAARLDDLYLYDVDALQEVAREHTELRIEEKERCTRILDEELEEFLAWKESLSMVPLIRELNETWSRTASEEIDKTLRKLSHLSEEDREEIEYLVTRLVNRLKHAPLKTIRDIPSRKKGESLVELVRRMLGLE